MTDFAGRPVFPAYFVDALGRPQKAASVTVYNRGTQVKATLYTDRAKATAAANPFLTDAAGNAFPYLGPGDYDAVVNGATVPFTVLPEVGDVTLVGQALYRSAPATLRTDGALSVGAALDHDGATAGFFGAAPVARPAALTAADASAVDIVYGAEEQAVLANVRTRVNELEAKLRALGLLA